MRYEKLSQESRDYIGRYIRGTSKTPQDALKELLIIEIIKEYEYGKQTT